MTPQNLAAHRDDPNFGFWTNLKEGYDFLRFGDASPGQEVRLLRR
jgi:murein L,D-transpeptidase YafK